MHRILAVAAVVVALTLAAAPSSGQVVANDAYYVNYYANNTVDGAVANPTVRIINTGQIGSPIDSTTKQGTVCADIYMFDDNQEMLECCSCPITANGLLFLQVDGSLLDSTLTAVNPDSGVIKIVADRQTGNACNPTQITNPVNGGLRAWLGHLQSAVVPTPAGQFTETEFLGAPLTNTEQAFLGNACSFVLYLGSGRGKCICTDSSS